MIRHDEKVADASGEDGILVRLLRHLKQAHQHRHREREDADKVKPVLI